MKMKFKFILLSTLVATTCLSGCKTSIAENVPSNKYIPASDEIIVSGSVTSELSKYFTSMEEMINESAAVIYGEIADYSIGVHNGTIFTKRIIHVIDSLYGDTENGTDITLYETGGYVLIRDYIDSYDTEESKAAHRNWLFENLTDEEVNTKYISETPEGYYYPEIGNRSVLFMIHRPNAPEEYELTGCWQGEYRETEDGSFIRPNSSNYLSESPATYSNLIHNYEELKEQIQNTIANQTVNQVKETNISPWREAMIIGVLQQTLQYNSPEEAMQDSDVIVYAEVVDFETCANGYDINTIKTLRVIECLYGDINAGTEIEYREPGGYVLISDFLNSFPTEEERVQKGEVLFGELTAEDMYTKYIGAVPEGYFYPETGARAVMLLKKSSEDSDFYISTGDWMGKYKETLDGLFIVPNTENSITDPDITGDYEMITYKDLKDKIFENTKTF